MAINEDKRAMMAHITMLKLLEIDHSYAQYPETLVKETIRLTDELIKALASSGDNDNGN